MRWVETVQKGISEKRMLAVWGKLMTGVKEADCLTRCIGYIQTLNLSQILTINVFVWDFYCGAAPYHGYPYTYNQTTSTCHRAQTSKHDWVPFSFDVCVSGSFFKTNPSPSLNHTNSQTYSIIYIHTNKISEYVPWNLLSQNHVWLWSCRHIDLFLHHGYFPGEYRNISLAHLEDLLCHWIIFADEI